VPYYGHRLNDEVPGIVERLFSAKLILAETEAPKQEVMYVSDKCFDGKGWSGGVVTGKCDRS